ncbi:GNAT family N-acetyltransferase [Paenibacillus sp. HN-1]|uniref:GNAT family N-acetyltransferase n=1 Tax=Paenibacillus TaxID=44249 RepID=UPI001CA86CDD|nr:MULTISPECIES: GNAT family N-acetyltransferase [Paenibacillus]MBY9079442.1 GNAT family N-acetyltransferase [Paenibacillus sp. CGMCC 1.18879]MBY9083423.1 GNAT family N-acetyltransferase [Paenibacillus sinensis]
MLYREGKITVRRLENRDRGHLADWLSDSRVLEWYEGRDNPFDPVKVDAAFFKKDETTRCLAEYEEQAVGYIQFYPLAGEEKRIYGYTSENVWGIDQFIGEPECWNRGIGTMLVSSMVRYLMSRANAERIVTDPRTINDRAIRCYEKCGFRKIRMLPEREWHEGRYQDCWLMEFRP